MKKVSLMIAALALVLGLSQCKKDEKPVASGEKQHIVLSASLGDSNSKIAEDGIGGLKWTDENGGTADVIKVYNSSKEEIGTLTCKNAANGTFEGDITTATGDITFTFGEQKFEGQSGLLNDAISLSATAAYDPTGNYIVTMTMPHAVLKLDLSAFPDDQRSIITTVTITSGNVQVASVTGITSASKAVYVAMPAAEKADYTFTGNGKTATKKDWPLEVNTFYTKSGSTTGEAIVIPATPAAPEGALSGLFTVDAGLDGEAGTDDDVKVYFSQGNLQYHTTNKTWRFANTQYALLDNDPSDHTTSNYDENTDTWIDLFGWGSTGNAPVGDEYYVHYQPWSTDNSSDGHSSDYNNYGYGPSTNSSSPDLSVSNGSDWGKNIGDGSSWRTLTQGEWNYLINTRKVKGETGYENTCVWAEVEGVGGLIIFPDDYEGATSDFMSIPDGCVFLPAAGNRGGTLVGSVGSVGRYWSSSYRRSFNAYYLEFDSGSAHPDYGCNRHYGCSVRLVSEKKKN